MDPGTPTPETCQTRSRLQDRWKHLGSDRGNRVRRMGMSTFLQTTTKQVDTVLFRRTSNEESLEVE